MSSDGSRDSREQAFRSANVRGIRAELQRLRLLLRRELSWLREHWPREPSPRPAATAIADSEIERHLGAELLLACLPSPAKRVFFREHVECRRLTEEVARLEAEIAEQRLQQVQQNRPLPLDLLCRLFRLGEFERDVLLLCLGAELDPALRRCYGYVQDDAARQRATPNLALRLFLRGEEQMHAAWHAFQPSAPLRFHGLIEASAEDSSLSRVIGLPERVSIYLQGFNRIDPEVSAWLRPVTVEPHAEAAQLASLEAWVRRELSGGCAPRLNLIGVPGSGRRALARALCQRLGLDLHAVELGALSAARPERLALLGREAVLSQTALYLDLSDADLLREPGHKALLDSIVERVPMFVFVASRKGHGFAVPLPRVTLEKPDAAAQLELWCRTLANSAELAPELENLVEQFSFGPSDIEAIATQAELRASVRQTDAVSAEDLRVSCREHGTATLDGLAQRLEPRHGWDDIILPRETRTQLEEVAGQVAQRAFVYGEWGFGAKLSRGRGISALFAGPSGTGKTMAAEVLATHLGLPIYRIDLSGVIDKYVGETEKNLSRVFEAAEQSGAILFFDEADALFGKRSEVKDSHDRYANIEINHLLQRMEDYRGLAILATNMKAHLDQAFLRRLRFVIDFPFPDLQERLAIWETAFPPNAAREGLDLRALSRLELTGASIKNIALNAAFLAAGKQTPITMGHVFRAAKREYSKMEKLMSELERHSGSFANLSEIEVN
jgi:hypothetical protein